MADVASVPAWVPVVSALGGGLVVGVLNVLNNWLNKKFEEKKHHKELMLSLAVEHWKQSKDLFIQSVHNGRRASLQPLDTYIIHMMKLAEVLGTEITKDELVFKLKEVDEVMSVVENYHRAKDAPPWEEKQTPHSTWQE
ncbi:hypothetical protein [Geomonas anaerohicana]|uniref:Uncharacterized protein n=1 Tax=Geomonas anaerohicana TaxID=2798583 RepID=A0ABS0YB90_9BACT|nr:hypothetical protein [Geomonas anaerohicana]MBJ6749557.1 hypothetical protein [Geomonas anaerohicana]